MRASSWSWVAALAIVGCEQGGREDAATPDEEPAAAKAPKTETAAAAAFEVTPPEKAPVPSGHAVVRVGGALHPSSSAAAAVNVVVGGKDPSRPPGVTVDIVGEENGRLVVETLGGAVGQHHCAGQLDGLSDLRLRLFVDRSDLLEITTAEVAHAFADGTKVTLSPGVPLAPLGGSDPLLARAYAAGTVVDVPVPKASRGTFHEPGEGRAIEGALGKVYADADPPSPLLLDGGVELSGSGLFHDGEMLAHYGVTSADGAAFVTLRNPCLEVVARTSASRLSEPAPTERELAEEYAGMFAVGGGEGHVWGGLVGGEIGEAYGSGGLGFSRGGTAPVEKSFSAKAGATVYWEDGKVAGQVLATRDFEGASREVDGRRCFDVPIVVGEDPKLAICIAAADLDENEVRNAGVLAPAGAYGMIGLGAGGFGSPSRGLPRSSVKPSKAEVKGSLDKDVIRRIVRRHVSQVRYCYEKLLVSEPTAEGKVTVRFVIGTDGSVSTAEVDGNTTGSSDLGKCVVKAVTRWKFPKPTGGSVSVTYPFVLTPGA